MARSRASVKTTQSIEPTPQPEAARLKKAVGRPKGPESTIVNVRIPRDVLERLDRYVDRLIVRRGFKANRGVIIRRALERLLETHEEDALIPS
jgi:hypothetical protein